MAGTDKKKLQELILYISRRSDRDPRFAKTKLFKILFYADFIAYMQTGQSITGEEYRKAPHGPMPAHGEETLHALKRKEALAIARLRYHGREQLRPLALHEPLLKPFSGEEIALVDGVIDELWEQDATEVSQLSHDFVGWQAAAMGEIIPYETSLIDNSPLTEEEEQWAAQFVPALT